jgi:hypothetical protein
MSCMSRSADLAAIKCFDAPAQLQRSAKVMEVLQHGIHYRLGSAPRNGPTLRVGVSSKNDAHG